jgi:hypothetical protein
MHVFIYPISATWLSVDANLATILQLQCYLQPVDHPIQWNINVDGMVSGRKTLTYRFTFDQYVYIHGFACS